MLKQFYIIVMMVLFALPAISDSTEKASENLVGLFDQRQAEHILLVAFKDASINRIQSSATAYRKRGDYQSTSWSENLSTQIAEDYHLQKLTEWPMNSIDMHCVVYQVPENMSMEDTLHRLTQDTRIELVQNLQTFTTQAITSNDPYFKLQTNLQAMHIDQVHTQTTGKQVKIAMIDTGADFEHPDLQGQIVEYKNYADAISASFNTDKHGTAVAGIMVAKKANGTGITGVAPDAHLLALKACWPNQTDAMAAACNSFTLALAVNKAINSGAKILNMSLTGPKDPLLEQLLSKAISKGMIVVVADVGDQKATENFPASMDNVLAVQASKPTDSQTSLNTARLKAPGDKILTTLPYGTYDFISGSSMATAEVSGIIALLLELKPDLTLSEIRTLLKTSSKDLTQVTQPVINVQNAILALCATTSCTQNQNTFKLARP